MKVRYSYLPQQFAQCDDLWQDLQKFVATGDFTLGQPLRHFEESFAELIGTRFAIGVNSGTDALKLSLKALGVRPGDEVITAANTFVATVGAIFELGATPRFVDCNETFCLDVDLVAEACTPKTRAIVPVHFTGYMTDMSTVLEIAREKALIVVEDACQSILASQDSKNAGTWGDAGAFSLHPLKNINVWADGGVITTDDESLAHNLRLLRNHGMSDRDTVECLGFNSRLDTLQAVVGNWLLPQAREIAEQRILNARYYDESLAAVNQIQIPPRPREDTIVYHLYVVYAEQRDDLLKYLLDSGIEAKVHYPVPIYRQPALKAMGHSKGDFPRADFAADYSISFPCDQHLTREQQDYVIQKVREFYETP
jgi:dTDP-4-amino-4,6-dideoxygalactose transaminase